MTDDDLTKDPRIAALEAARSGGGRLDENVPAAQGTGLENSKSLDTGEPVAEGNGLENSKSLDTGDVVAEGNGLENGKSLDKSAHVAEGNGLEYGNGNGNGNGHGEPQRTVVVKRNGDSAPRATLEGWAIAAFFAIVYGIVGYFVITDGHVISFDGMHRLNEAYMTWWNSPPRISAIGLEQAPIGAVAFLPFALIKPLATSLVAMPVLTAIAAGMLMALINSILRRCEVAAGFRYLMVLVFGLNPMLVFYAGNGEPVVLGMVMMAVALLSIISWHVTDETRGLVGAGLAVGTACLIDYSYGVWAIGLVMAVLIIASGKSGGDDRISSSVLVFMTPIVYAIFVWSLLNWIILGNPFDWVNTNPQMIAANSTDTFRNVTATPEGAFGDLGKVVLGVAPLGFVALIMLFFAGIFSGSRLAWGLIFVAVAAIAAPIARVLIADQADLMMLSIGLPLAVLALAAMAAVHQAGGGLRVPSAILILIGLVAAVPLGWNAMQDYDYQDQAQAFTRYIDTRDNQEGTKSLGGYTVGIDPERTMAGYIKTELPQKDDSILVDQNVSYGVMILTGRPYLFADQSDEGTGDWEMLRDDPFGKVDYMLVAIVRNADSLAKSYPKMLAGGENGLTPVFKTDRYVLVKVAAEAPVISSEPGQPSTAPRPVEPSRPPSAGSGDSASSTFDEANGSSGSSSGGSTSGSSSSSSGSSGQTTAPSLEGE